MCTGTSHGQDQQRDVWSHCKLRLKLNWAWIVQSHFYICTNTWWLGAISASGNSPRSLCLNCSQGHVSSGVIRIRPVTLLTILVLLEELRRAANISLSSLALHKPQILVPQNWDDLLSITEQITQIGLKMQTPASCLGIYSKMV